MDENNARDWRADVALFRALGKANDFFFGDGQTGPSFAGFREWAEQSVIAPNGSQRAQILSWLPPSLRIQGTLDDWITTIARDLIAQLEAIMRDLQLAAVRAEDAEDDNDDEGAPDEDRNALGDEELLEFLFSRGMLPSYAFPTDLTSFLVERLVPVPRLPCSRMSRNSFIATRAVSCGTWTSKTQAETDCPVCSGHLQRTRMIVPQVFTPEDGRALPEDNREQDIAYATGAQFPVPVGTNDLPDLEPRELKFPSP